MRGKKVYLVALIVIVLLGALSIYKAVEIKSRQASISQANQLKRRQNQRILKCWVRERAPRGYDNYGHELQPANVALNRITLKLDKNTWIIYSKSFSGKTKQDKTYYIKPSNANTLILYNAKQHQLDKMTMPALIKQYKEQTI